MIEFPDVSHWQGKLSIIGAKALTAKMTEGTSFYDPTFTWYAAQAARLAIPFLPYHFLRSANPHNQAAHAAGVIGGGGPLMLDIETAPDGTFPTITTTKAFIAAYPGRVTLAYIPRWFWAQHWGAADLTWLTELGIGLISSDYNTTPPDGWLSYGGVTPVIWQYTATGAGWGSTNLDMNRFNGTSDQLAHLFQEGTADMALTPDQAQDFEALIYRVEAIINNRPTVVGGPTTGEKNLLHDAIAAIPTTTGAPTAFNARITPLGEPDATVSPA